MLPSHRLRCESIYRLVKDMDWGLRVIQNDVYYSEQSWNLRLVVKIRQRHSIRVRIRRHSGDDSSYGIAEYWNGCEWSEVIRRPISKLYAQEISYVHREHEVKAHLLLHDAVDLIGRTLHCLPVSLQYVKGSKAYEVRMRQLDEAREEDTAVINTVIRRRQSRIDAAYERERERESLTYSNRNLNLPNNDPEGEV